MQPPASTWLANGLETRRFRGLTTKSKHSRPEINCLTLPGGQSRWVTVSRDRAREGLLKWRDTIVRLLVGFDIVRFDKIADYAMALGHANTMHLIATQPPDELQAIHDESAAMRETLYTDSMALVRRGLIKLVSRS